MSGFNAADIARLDRAYSTPQIADQRRRFREALAAQPGEFGLDVGCGAGHLAWELAREVTPGGRIVGIDKSDDSVAAAKARIVREELADRITVQVGDATELEFKFRNFRFRHSCSGLFVRSKYPTSD